MLQSLLSVVVILCLSFAVKSFVISHRFNNPLCASSSSTNDEQNPKIHDAEIVDVYHMPGKEVIVDKPLTHIKQNKVTQ